MNIVITGASNGIGYQTALLLTKQGHTVFAIARNKNNLEKLKEESERLNPTSKVHCIVADITEEVVLKKIEEQISVHTKTIQVLINNAGLLINKPFELLTAKDWSDVYSTNFFAAVNLIRELLPFLNPLVLGGGTEV